jgi:hypothetical protein
VNQVCFGACAAVAACCGLSSIASAGLFVTTGQTGAQVQCDVNHTQYWTFTVTADVSSVDGAVFTMKRGSQANSTITFRVFEGFIGDAATASDLLSITLNASSFTQSFTSVLFQDTKSARLKAGRTYTGVLFSAAPDVQSRAYFIKGGSATPLAWCDQTGFSSSPGPVLTTISIPAPGASAILALAGAAIRRRRN